MDRRSFSKALAAGGFAGLVAMASGGCATTAMRAGARSAWHPGPLVRDPDGILDLPEGWRYRIVSRLGDVMSDGIAVGDKADGMGCIPLSGGKVALVRNHELSLQDLSRSPFAGRRIDRAYDRFRGGDALPGGTSTIVYDLKRHAVEAQYATLVGTIRNCAGGTTPWGTWLSCEEDVSRADDRISRDHGWVFEVPARATGLIDPIPLRGLGRFNHEAAAVDPRTGIVYLTEDRDDGLLYRFIPNRPGELLAGGRLQALALAEQSAADTRNWSAIALRQGESARVRWIDLDNTDSPDDDLRQRGHARGAALFARGEGIHFGDGEFYFVCTSGGAKKLGQVFRYRPARNEGLEGSGISGAINNFFESTDPLTFNFGDNIAIAPNGHLIVCEDQYTDIVDNHLRGITPQGEAYAFGRCRLQTEMAGACFSPDGSTMFVNIYSPAMTLAITGPGWRL